MEMASDVFLPAGDGPFPTVVQRTPYGRPGTGFALRLVDFGYAVVSVDMRGRGDSDGEWQPLVKDSEDGYDVVEWASAQSWSTGNVGTVGQSYAALAQWWAAEAHPPSLRCMVPTAVGVAIEAGGWGTRGTRTFWLWWLSFVLGRTNQNVATPNWEHVIFSMPLETIDERLGLARTAWRRFVLGEIDYLSPEFALSPEAFATFDIPVLVIVGWWDDQKTMLTWKALQNARSVHDCRLLIGPWGHFGNSAPQPVLGGLDVSPGVIDTVAHVEQFLAVHLKGEHREIADQARCRIFRTGENRWEYLDEWPAPDATPTAWYFGSGGDARTLSGNGTLRPAPSGEESADTYTSDPVKPRRSRLNLATFAVSDPPLDERYRLRRPDTLVYTSDVLVEPIRVSGRAAFELTLSSDRVDTDVFLSLSDVYPDGRVIALSAGRGSVRLSHADPGHVRFLRSGEQLQVKLEDPWVHHTFLPGHRILVAFASTHFPESARNSGTGEHWAESTELVPQTNRLHHGTADLSRLLLPVQPAQAAHQ
jgi:putative CocE/NonD family hydrolase